MAVKPNNTGLGYCLGQAHPPSQFMTPHPTSFHYFLLPVPSCLCIAVPAIPPLKVRSLSASILAAQLDNSDPGLLQWLAVELLNIPVCCFLGCGHPVHIFLCILPLVFLPFMQIVSSQRGSCAYILKENYICRGRLHMHPESLVLLKEQTVSALMTTHL